MEKSFVVGEFAVFEGVRLSLYKVVVITGEKLEKEWPVVVHDTGEHLHVPESELFKIDWSRG